MCIRDSKYPFHEQLMIYAQRPDATACAEYDLWNEKMGDVYKRQDYYHLLKKWGIDHSPRTPEEEPHHRFVEAIQKKPYVEYLLDLFLYESEEEPKAWIAEHTAEITHLERLSLIHI